MKKELLWRHHLRRILLLGLIIIASIGCAGNDGDDNNNVPAGLNLPIADAGPDQEVFTNLPVTLDGSGSSSADSATLTYSWSFKRPEDSMALLSDPSSSNPTFIPDVNGTYEIRLIVNDGTNDSAPHTAMVEASPIYAYGFEEGLGDWSIEGNPTWEVGTPDYGPDGPYSGSSCAGTNLNGPYPIISLSWLKSPSIELPEIEAGDKFYLNFFHWFEFAIFTTGKVYMSREISSDVWSDWELLKDATYTNVSPKWSKAVQVIEMPDDHIVKRVRFKFQLASFGLLNLAGWYVDDIEISF